MKKIIALIMVTVMLFTLVACGKEATGVTNTSKPTNVESNITSSDVSSDNTEENDDAASSIEGTPSTETNDDPQDKVPQTEEKDPEAQNKVPQTQDKDPGTQNTKPVHTHTYSKATCVQPATCSCGAINGAALGHDYTVATCTAPQTCKVCAATQGDALGHNYVLGECTRCNDYSSEYIPKLYFTGDMSKMTSKKDVREISFEYVSKQQKSTGAAKIKVQGTSSLNYEKKNYTINFYKNSDYSQKLGIDVGWGSQNEYCLKANWIDKTHARNIVTAKLAGEIQKKYGVLNGAPNNGAIDGFPIEVYINGSFHGLYTMNIPKSEWMFGMDKDNPNHIVICGENWTDPVLFKDIPTDFSGWSVEAGPENDETLAKVQRLVSFVCDSSDKEFKANFDKYLDLDSTINYYIMLNFCWLGDNVGKNMLLATYDGKVWYPSLYDLDTSWGTHYTGKELYNYKDSLLSVRHGLLWKRLEEHYRDEIVERYFELRSTILDEDYIMAKFNNFYDSVPEEVWDRENEKWDPKGIGEIPGYPISQIQEYLDYMLPKLDAKYGKWK